MASSHALADAPNPPGNADLVCLSHLRWDFVFQRPQHLMTRFAKERRVFYFEEPVLEGDQARLAVKTPRPGLSVVTPHLPPAMPKDEQELREQQLFAQYRQEQGIVQPIVWYYTPMAYALGSALAPSLVVYDCMDELSLFAGAPPLLREREAQLLRGADLVFTGGQSLFESKRDKAKSVHCFPSSVDVPHFARARTRASAPPDQAGLGGLRVGFFGVIDERLDIELLREAARQRPSWQWIMIGPVVKIDPGLLPRADNIHYLGAKTYAELPDYIAGWDVAILPFARNDATRFISPTKTPEYLAAGCPVVSTSIRDVVRPYGELGFAHIADTPSDFVAAIEEALREDSRERQRRVDEFLANNSWDRTFAEMGRLLRMPADRQVLDKSAGSRSRILTHAPTLTGRAAARTLRDTNNV